MQLHAVNSTGTLALNNVHVDLRPTRTTFSVQFAGLAFLYYDYILTLSDEIKYVWRSRWRLSTLFYIFCRYALVANVIYYLSIAKEPQILEM
ncbi:hypothetical protein BKA70DRAFT_738158 [Coprinopsis sp. MPI-PUGE-AT-0042]|nr:hypothetical protein BKA70DRAFT_738158 [Coprinopsis sp. MPI-PUGE-AT-0042]